MANKNMTCLQCEVYRCCKNFLRLNYFTFVLINIWSSKFENSSNVNRLVVPMVLCPWLHGGCFDSIWPW